MFRPCLGLRGRLLGLLVVPPLLWALVVAAVPTDWARRLVIDRLARTSGRTVRLGALRLGYLGGVRLQELEVAEPATPDDPWLRVERLHLNLGLLQLACGHCEPTRVEAEGVALRVHRRPDGSFEFGDLLRPRRDPSPAAGAVDLSEDACAVEFDLRRGRLTLIDEPTDTRLDFTEVEGKGSWDRQKAEVESLHGRLNGGPFALAAQLDREADPPHFEGQVRAQDVSLTRDMGALGYLAPVLSEAAGTLEGRLALNLYLKGEGTSCEEVRRSVVGQGTLTLDPIRLDGSPIVAELANLLELAPRDRVGSVHSQLQVGRGRVVSAPLTLTLGTTPLTLTGWTDFDGRMDYRFRQDGLAARIPQQARELLSDLPVELDRLLDLHFEGSLHQLHVSADGIPLNGPDDPSTPVRHADQRLRLREFGRKLRDRVLR